MSNEIDLEQFIQVLDHALATDDVKIKKALRKFLFIAALAMDEDPEPGPFTAMFEEMDDLRQRVKVLESQGSAIGDKSLKDLTDYFYGGNNNTWINTTGTGTSSGTVTVNPSSTSTSTLYGPGSGYTTTTTAYPYYTIDLGDDEKGKRIKKELKEKLGMLNKVKTA